MALSLTAADLGTYLDFDEINGARAEMLIAHAMNLAATYVTPVPDEAAGIILAAAGRAYVNPAFATQEMETGYQVMRQRGGVYLEDGEIAALQRLSGGPKGAFEIDTMPSGGA